MDDKEKTKVKTIFFFFLLQFSFCNQSSHISEALEPQVRDWGNEVPVSINSCLRPTGHPWVPKGCISGS